MLSMVAEVSVKVTIELRGEGNERSAYLTMGGICDSLPSPPISMSDTEALEMALSQLRGAFGSFLATYDGLVARGWKDVLGRMEEMDGSGRRSLGEDDSQDLDTGGEGAFFGDDPPESVDLGNDDIPF